MSHPVVPKLRDYEWLCREAVTADLALSGLVLSGCPGPIVASQRDALAHYLTRLDAAHDAVRRCLTGS